MPDYSKGKIYTIRCLNDPNIYVGSTIQTLSVRMGKHRNDYLRDRILGKNKDIVKDINEWKIELHELYPCLTREELLRREGEVIREIGTLNICIAGRTQKEWCEDNPEKRYESRKRYLSKNVEHFKNYKKEYRLKNIEIIKEKDKKYNLENAENIKIKRHETYIKKKLEKTQP